MMLNEMVNKLDNRLEEAESQISTSEDRNAVAERLLSFLLQSNQYLQEKCQDLENQERCKNLRIYGVTEDAENGYLLKFIDSFIKGLLNLSPELNLGIERAHRSLQKKPTNPMDPQRSIVPN